MRTETEVVSQVREWSEREEVVRATVLTSSRANPHSEIDFLSDYDIELYVSDRSPFEKNDDWLVNFGRIMVRWPYAPRATFSDDWITRLVLFKDGVRIDFQITDKREVEADRYDNGYRIIVDKDGLLKNLALPSFTTYLIKKPSQEEYDELINDFWWDATYVPKYLWRDQLPFAKSMFARAVHDTFLRKIIEWYIGLQHDWAVATGLGGRYFKRFLDARMWKEFESTYAGSDIDENWEAFFNAVSLFTRLAKYVGDALDYRYPVETEKEMTAYYQSIKAR